MYYAWCVRVTPSEPIHTITYLVWSGYCKQNIFTLIFELSKCQTFKNHTNTNTKCKYRKCVLITSSRPKPTPSRQWRHLCQASGQCWCLWGCERCPHQQPCLMSAGCLAKKTKDKKTIKSSDKDPSTITCYIKQLRWGGINNPKPLLRHFVSLGLLFIEEKLEELHPLSVKQRSNSTLPFNGAQPPRSHRVYREKHAVLF